VSVIQFERIADFSFSNSQESGLPYLLTSGQSGLQLDSKNLFREALVL
jgi:hypothetical protein